MREESVTEIGEGGVREGTVGYAVSYADGVDAVGADEGEEGGGGVGVWGAGAAEAGGGREKGGVGDGFPVERPVPVAFRVSFWECACECG